jgi:outer membrane protein assembly factor BamB/serine/threonine protein kinase
MMLYITPKKSLIHLLFAVLLLICSFFSFPVTAEDAMFRVNPQHTGVYDNGGIMPTNVELWRFNTEDAVLSSPTVSNDTVYFGGNKNLYAINTITGKEKWHFITGAFVFSSPAVSNGTVCVGSEDKNLYAIDVVTGKEKWRFTTGRAIYASPVISGGIVYIGSYDKNLYAIDMVTGAEIWRFITGGDVDCSPAVSNGIIYLGIGDQDKNLYAIDAVTGKEKWQFIPPRRGFAASPAVFDNIVYIGSLDNNLYAIDAVSGMQKWKFTTGDEVDSSPAVSNGIVYFGSKDNNLYAIDAVSGMQKWKFTTGDEVDSSPAVSNGIVYFGSKDNNLYAIDAVFGTQKWKFTTRNKVDSSPAVSNGIVFVGSWDYNLYAIGQTSQNSNTTIPFILIILILIILIFCSGAGYGIYRIRRYAELPYPADESLPPPSPFKRSSTEINDSGEIQKISDRLKYISKKASNLTTFRTTISSFLSEAHEQFNLGNYKNTQKILEKTDLIIISLARCESQISLWKSEGFDTLPVENLKTDNIDKIPSDVQEYEHKIEKMKNITQQVQDLTNANTFLLKNPNVRTTILKLEKNSKSPLKVNESEKTLSELINQIDTLQKLRSCEESLEQYTKDGYSVPTLEDLQSRPAKEIILSVNKLGERINTLKRINEQISRLQNTDPALLELPQIKPKVEEIQRNLKDPSCADDLEKQFQTLDQLFSQYRIIWAKRRQILTESLEKIQQYPEICGKGKVRLEKLQEDIADKNCDNSEQTFKAWAEDNLASFERDLEDARQQTIICPLSTDLINLMIEEGKYAEALIAVEKQRAELTRTEQLFRQASSLMDTTTSPKLMELYNTGKYEEFIDQALKTQELLSRWNGALTAANKDVVVPATIIALSSIPDTETLSHAFQELEDFIKNARPVLEVSLGTTQFTAGKWYKTSVLLSNSGNAHAFDVNFSISEEFESKRIKPTQVEAGKTVTVDIGLMPKNIGSIPFEITVHCRDGQNRSYDTTHEFWVDVVDKMSLTPEKDAQAILPQSPISQFSPTPQTPKQLPQELSDHYKESEFIGKGGFARVFKAKRKDGKYVAVKIPISLDASTGRSFIAEMQNWTKLDHPNIVRVYEYNIMPTPYFEMELCDGSLAEMKKPLEAEEAAWVLFSVCEGLKYTHKRSIVHRDLKPQNILLKNGIPKISDWGLSKVISDSASTTATSFTPYYAAPEQVNNKQKDERTDIWQLGVILYELTTGELPFRGDSIVEVAMNIVTKDPRRPADINPGAMQIEPVILKCLHKDPAERYQSVLELQKDLGFLLRKNYVEQLTMSVSSHDLRKSAFYCGDLVMINLLTGDIVTAYKYLSDLAIYAEGDVKTEVMELSEQIRTRMEYGLTEIPDELIQKAEIIVHKVSLHFRM